MARLPPNHKDKQTQRRCDKRSIYTYPCGKGGGDAPNRPVDLGGLGQLKAVGGLGEDGLADRALNSHIEGRLVSLLHRVALVVGHDGALETGK